MHRNELRNRVLRRADAPIVQIPGVIEMRQQSDIDVHPLHGLIGLIGDGVAVAQPRYRAGRSLQHGRSTVNRILRFAVKNDEHFLAVIVEVLSDTATRRQHSPMQEKQVHTEIEFRGIRGAVEQRHVIRSDPSRYGRRHDAHIGTDPPCAMRSASGTCVSDSGLDAP